MIVTAGAGNRQPHDAAGERVHAVLQLIRLGLGLTGGSLAELRSQPLKSESGQPGHVIGGGPGNFIAGNLQSDKFVIGKILIEGVHHPVAIQIGGRSRR